MLDPSPLCRELQVRLGALAPESSGQAARPDLNRGRPEWMPTGVFAALSLSLDLTPLAASALVEALGLDRAGAPVRRFEPEERLLEANAAPGELLLITSGSARGVVVVEADGVVKADGVRSFGLYREGLWVGAPQALMIDKSAPALINYEVVATGKVEALALSLDDIRALVQKHPSVGRYFEALTLRRFGAQRAWRSALESQPVLSMLEPVDLDWLMQVGAVRRHPDPRSNWLKAGRAAEVAGLLLEGRGQAHLPEAGRSILVGEYEAGDLMGHEQLAWPEDEAGVERLEGDPLDVKPPAQRTDVRLFGDAMVLEVSWRALRWLMFEKLDIWARFLGTIRPGEAEAAKQQARIVVVFGAEEKLGTTTLAHGAALALARSPWRGDAPVCLIDLQHPGSIFGAEVPEGELRQGDLIDGEEDDFTYRTAELDAGDGARLRVMWCEDPLNTVSLLRYLRNKGEASAIVVSGGINASQGRQAHARGEPVTPAQQEAMALAEGIAALGVVAVWLTDSPHKPYSATAVAPKELIRAERLSAEYLRAEEIRTRVEMSDWIEAGYRHKGRLLKRARSLLGELEVFNSEELRGRFSHGAARHVLRVPDDPKGVEAFRCQAVKESFGVRPRLPLIETFERLARMIQGRTFGLALGGGGAWGFTQIALLRALEDADVPIDYIAGASFGSVVGGLYAAGGMKALDRLLEWSATRPTAIAQLQAVFGVNERGRPDPMVFNRLTVSVNMAVVSNGQLQRFIDDLLEEVTGERRMPLSTTRIPFLPVGTRLNDGVAVVMTDGTVGFGVRSASCLPPLFPTLHYGSDRIIDGGLVANVPVEAVRDRGADFVVGCNVVPPNPPALSNGALRQMLLELKADQIELALKGLEVFLDEVSGTPGRPSRVNLGRAWRAWRQTNGGGLGDVAVDLYKRLRAWKVDDPAELASALARDVLLSRLLDAVHGFYLLSWRQGQDQSALKANFVISMKPEKFQSHDFHLGREIVKCFEHDIAKAKVTVVEELKMRWSDPARWKDKPHEAHVPE